MKKLVKITWQLSALSAACYLYFALLLYFTCKNILCFQEGVATFVGEVSLLHAMTTSPAGIARLCALWLTQWFGSPWSAVLVGAIPFTFITMLTYAIARRLGCGICQMSLIALPATALALMSCNIDYNFTGTTAYAFMLLGILPLAYIKNIVVRLAVALVNCLLVAWTGGAIVMLYAIVVLNIELLRNWRKGWMFAILPALAFCYGWLCIEHGYCRDMSRALTPYAYYTHWTALGASSFLPWIMSIAVVNASALLKLLRSPKGYIWQALLATCALAAVTLVGARDNRNIERDAFARLSYLSSRQDWQQIANEYKTMPQDNPTLQNITNMALAERDMLGDALFRHANVGVASLHNSEDHNPYSYMSLSDIYYSMGLVALAQRYAFEANEALGNYSPRMLMRLVDTNIITRQYAVARKYISLLERTIHYAAWAAERRKMADGETPLDSVLAAKRACLFPDNRFAGDKGIDDDLLQVLRANNLHAPTMQYLCAYYMLSKNVPPLINLIEEFHGTPALRTPLPEHLQEAVAIDAIVSGTGIEIKYQIHPSVLQRCKAFWADHQPQPNTFWHYLRNSRQPQSN